MKKILITGANSYIGTSFEKYLSQWPDAYQVDTIDMVDGSWRKKSFAGYDSIFHVAGIAHISAKRLHADEQKQYWIVNAQLPIEVADKAKKEGAKQFIFLSSMSVYGEHGSIRHPVVIDKQTIPNPKDIYGKSKLFAEAGLCALQGDDFSVCILRPPMVYGPGCRGNYPLLEKAALKLPFFPKIKNERSMLHIDNLCRYIKSLIDENSSGTHFPQNPTYVCTSQMVKSIAEAKGKNIRLTSVFNPLLKLFSGKVGIVDKVFGTLIYKQDM